MSQKKKQTSFLLESSTLSNQPPSSANDQADPLSFLSEIPSQVPRDESDPSFTKSFDPLTEMTQAKEFFQEWGFAVFRNVLNSEQVEKSVHDVFDYLESGQALNTYSRDLLKRNETPLKREDISTWTNSNWPAMKEEGILGVPPVFTKQAMENRQNELLYHVFKEVTGQEKLWVSMDRYGFFRPTKNVSVRYPANHVKKKNEEGNNQTEEGLKEEYITEVKDFPEYKSKRNVHFDRNPWSYVFDLNSLSGAFPHDYMYLPGFCVEYNEAGRYDDGIVKLQALLNFVDNREQDGGFIIVPKFHKHFLKWVNATKKTLGAKHHSSFLVLNSIQKEIAEKGVRVPLRAGDLLIWDIIMPHGSAPNDSERYRLCQFLKMFPAQPLKKERMKLIHQAVQKNGMHVTELGEKLFGLKEW
ncbi:hypothetical protein C9374_014645 [Naegleria lovaniensis]|uniref:Phytanoyl-CoA dioxygenase n=1 Tax=Naegleria lovaniensis TaxID=51637 RepID=A0AA88KMR7_NAELO|nr:uncharacterized protein C9374_014645 [Naegleria lovaniensis]KAG2389245.1 hypothetical protein C9374_014645 [Naegleria lovaniensis]